MSEQSEPKIAVLGAGALGSYFGARLARAGLDVTLIGRSGHVDAIKRDGLLLQSGDAEERIAIGATTDMAALGGASVVLFCVKSLDTEDAAAKMAPHLAPDAIILSLQNGVDNAERIRLHVSNQVIPVLVYIGANIPAPGHVRHTGGAHLIVGQLAEFRGRDAEGRLLDEIVALFTRAGLAVRISGDIEADLWTKLVMNCAYNAICALCSAPYGRIVASPEVVEVMREVVAEVVLVARAKGVELPGDIADRAIKFADAMPQTMSSTAQDIAKGKRTEIDHLNGYVARQGEALDIPTPVNRTLSALTKLLEQTRSASPAGV
jgi:2-dehydropantoate 2-reductase